MQLFNSISDLDILKYEPVFILKLIDTEPPPNTVLTWVDFTDLD